MKKAEPNYYSSFSCIADKCKHTCCVGWEIAVDKDKRKYYDSVDGDLGKRLSESISDDGNFILDDNDRCPFLNTSGLCDIISELGESALCTICREHPRFYNFYSDFCEVGIGMCCERAAEVILGFEQPFAMECAEECTLSAEEQFFFSLRRRIFDIIQDRSCTITQRLENLCLEYDFSFSDISLNAVVDLLLSLEHLDSLWAEELNKIRNCKVDYSFLDSTDLAVPFEQLLCYFVLRHFSIATGNYYESVCFVCAAFATVSALCFCRMKDTGKAEIADVADCARMFSAEVEYSSENTSALMKFFE